MPERPRSSRLLPAPGPGPRRCARPRLGSPRPGLLLVLVLVLAGCAGGRTGQAPATTPVTGSLPAALMGAEGDPIVFLVRHAERATDDPRDPTLTPEGTERAELLATLLAGAGITAIYSTDWRRTRLTAAPLAEATGLPVRIYDPGDSTAMAAFAREVVEEGGRVVVVGHSNTVGPTVARLGGDPGTSIADDEYDRLYVVVPAAPGGNGRTTLLRYGRPWPGGGADGPLTNPAPPPPGR